MGLFDGVREANPTGSYRYIQPGKYLALLIGCKQVDRPQKKGLAYANELLILKVLATEGDHTPCVVGSTYSHMVTPNVYFDSTMKAMFMGIMGMDEEQAAHPKDGVTVEFLEAVVGDDQPLQGTVIEIHAWTKITKEKGVPFTQVEYVRSNIEGHPNQITEEELADVEIPTEYTSA